MPSLHVGSLEITATVPLKIEFESNYNRIGFKNEC